MTTKYAHLIQEGSLALERVGRSYEHMSILITIVEKYQLMMSIRGFSFFLTCHTSNLHQNKWQPIKSHNQMILNMLKYSLKT